MKKLIVKIFLIILMIGFMIFPITVKADVAAINDSTVEELIIDMPLESNKSSQSRDVVNDIKANEIKEEVEKDKRTNFFKSFFLKLIVLIISCFSIRRMWLKIGFIKKYPKIYSAYKSKKCKDYQNDELSISDRVKLKNNDSSNINVFYALVMSLVNKKWLEIKNKSSKINEITFSINGNGENLFDDEKMIYQFIKSNCIEGNVELNNINKNSIQELLNNLEKKSESNLIEKGYINEVRDKISEDAKCACFFDVLMIFVISSVLVGILGYIKVGLFAIIIHFIDLIISIITKCNIGRNTQKGVNEKSKIDAFNNFVTEQVNKNVDPTQCDDNIIEAIAFEIIDVK